MRKHSLSGKRRLIEKLAGARAQPPSFKVTAFVKKQKRLIKIQKLRPDQDAKAQPFRKAPFDRKTCRRPRTAAELQSNGLREKAEAPDKDPKASARPRCESTAFPESAV